ncbi:hypothetical protein HYU90_00600 [Candidatus Collierbacteria bacterium]|nr:hypothetical protein [Candidatus Collierbacteria bacterium]
MAKEQDGEGRAQSLLDFAQVSQRGSKARAAERASEEGRLREQSLRVIEQDSVYQEVIKVMEDPTLDQLLPLFWRVWKPIVLVPEERVSESQIKFRGRVLRTIEKRYLEDVARPVPFPGLRKIPPLDPMEFVNQFPAGGTLFGEYRISPIAAYLLSIGQTTIDGEVERAFSGGLRPLCISHRISQEDYNRQIFEIRWRCSSFGRGRCGVIELKTPPPPGRMGDQGKLQIEAGYDLQREGFLIKLHLNSPYMSVAETFSNLTGLQYKLAEILVENGVTSVD